MLDVVNIYIYIYIIYIRIYLILVGCCRCMLGVSYALVFLFLDALQCGKLQPTMD